MLTAHHVGLPHALAHAIQRVGSSPRYHEVLGCFNSSDGVHAADEGLITLVVQSSNHWRYKEWPKAACDIPDSGMLTKTATNLILFSRWWCCGMLGPNAMHWCAANAERLVTTETEQNLCKHKVPCNMASNSNADPNALPL